MDLVAHCCSQGVGNFDDRLWGVSMILVTVSRHAREVLAQLQDEYPGLLLPSIPRRVALQDAALSGLPVTTFEPNSDAAHRFLALAKEVLDRAKNLAA
jgi:cellulose biosynthesis protein BcsQ